MKIAYVLMSWEVMLGMVGSHDRVVSDLPGDARVVNVVLLNESRQAQVYFTSEQVAYVPEGATIPMFEPHLSSVAA